jgi:hypothetical protein
MAKSEKPKKPKDNRTQSERFTDTAKELGADESGEAFERAFKKVVPPRRDTPRRSDP